MKPVFVCVCVCVQICLCVNIRSLSHEPKPVMSIWFFLKFSVSHDNSVQMMPYLSKDKQHHCYCKVVLCDMNERQIS